MKRSASTSTTMKIKAISLVCELIDPSKEEPAMYIDAMLYAKDNIDSTIVFAYITLL